jgi:hypothetical protein
MEKAMESSLAKAKAAKIHIMVQAKVEKVAGARLTRSRPLEALVSS